jgi:hypothetical protein
VVLPSLGWYYHLDREREMQTIQCPKCPAEFPAKYAGYAADHAKTHARDERNHAERAAMDAALTAAYGPMRRDA